MNHGEIILLEQHLARAENDIAQGESHIARQECILLSLERDGHPTGQARELLNTMQQSLHLHLATRNRLKRELALRREVNL